MAVYIVGSGRWAQEIFKVCFFELKIKEIMETCMEFKVPSVVDISIGDDFGQAS
jgi:DNA polymerase I-like protein with 3'-5' exonuclease and polymerase domains